MNEYVNQSINQSINQSNESELIRPSYNLFRDSQILSENRITFIQPVYQCATQDKVQ